MKYAELSGSSDQDILDYLKLHDLQYVDNRTKKGCLWIKGDKDISPIIKNIKKIYGISFIFKSEVKCLAGGPGWWLKERKIENVSSRGRVDSRQNEKRNITYDSPNDSQAKIFSNNERKTFVIHKEDVDPTSSPEQRAIYNLLVLYEKKGFVTEDDILEECDKVDLSFFKIDYVGNQILSHGVLISDGLIDKGDSESIVYDFDSMEYIPDLHSDIDGIRNKKVYDFYLEFYPEMRNIIIASANSSLISEREVIKLLPQIRSGNKKAKELLIVSLIIEALVFSLYYRGITSIALDEIFSEAMVGINEAIYAFDQYSKYTFYNTIKYYMRKRVDRYIANNEYIIKRPLDLRGRIIAKKIMSNHHYNYQYDKNISDEILFEAINEFCMTVNSHRYIDKEEYISIEEMIENECEIVSIDSYDVFRNVNDIIYKDQLRNIFNMILSKLTPREQLVINLRYGLEDNCYKTLEEVGRHMFITRERVRQIEAKAFRKIKHPSRLKYLSGYYSKKKR